MLRSFFGWGKEAAVKMFKHLVLSATNGGLYGALFSVALYLILHVPFHLA